MKLKCACGSSDLKELKFAGNIFNVTHKEKMVWLKGQGYDPDVWVCNSCQMILFSMKLDDWRELREKDGEDW